MLGSSQIRFKTVSEYLFNFFSGGIWIYLVLYNFSFFRCKWFSVSSIPTVSRDKLHLFDMQWRHFPLQICFGITANQHLPKKWHFVYKHKYNWKSWKAVNLQEKLNKYVYTRCNIYSGFLSSYYIYIYIYMCVCVCVCVCVCLCVCIRPKWMNESL